MRFLIWTTMSARWLRIAHRGASGIAPEHTQAAFEGALALGVDMIELDVQLSRDGQLVVIHDPHLERTTTGHGQVREHDFAYLRSLDAGAWFDSRFVGQRLLSLEQVVDIVGTRARLNVEIKAPVADWSRLVPELVDLLRARGLFEATIVSSFEMGVLHAVRGHAADVQIGLLWQYPDVADVWRLAADLRAVSFHPHWTLASPEVIAKAHRQNMQVLVWTVNDVTCMRQLASYGVDGIMSDFPDRFTQLSNRTANPEDG
jgi:glycerophosphoryl diester phosphodiesterase